MDFDTARLRAFLETAERGTVAAAAKALGYTAPAVSQQLTKLEAQLGASLFDRVGGRLRISPQGERLLPVARQILELSEQAGRTAGEIERPRTLVIAGFASAISTVVLPFLASRRARGMSIEIHEAEDEVALRDLRLGHVDIAVIQEYDQHTGQPGAARSERLTYTTLLSDRLRLLAPPNHPPTVRLADLAGSGWLVNGAGTRCEEATQQVLVAAGITPRITGRVADNGTLLGLVAAGHGATIAPELVLAGRVADVTVATADLKARRTILGVTRTAVAADYTDVLTQLAAVAKGALRRSGGSGRKPGAG